ncbi:DNA/RNA non-specific endonuclease [Enterococcus thailandicus]|uniref:DNA/RNA non-specific endonuclease n=1 Tax=Enterococcus thailandicus TaxID=417368 RepID=UPI0022EBAABD|nr:DNA/RNA non-specific endonuclease [Enterococcus thailandicus]MDA3973583.1 DNA/RNA non-specific endonuclease [Enterococcus thailandicus]MDA3975832.1 DNA/RNA non-specific endonuclease [Enterococcus thailandicus]MDA3981042.1 DNA/RNA non-specific endonuclease [Enterococcus thailandicus]
MKNMNKLLGTLLTLLIVGAASWLGLDLNSSNDKSTPSSTTQEQVTQQHTQNGLPTKEDLAPTGNNSGPKEVGLATFSADELKDNQNGWITYHSLDQLKRPTGAEALIKKKMINTGTSANREIRPPGFVSGPKYDHSRGHLIAKQFGGSGDERKNLVTLYQFPVNDPYMNYYELAIRQALNKGETVRYRVTPNYTKNELIPESVTLEAQGLNANTTINFKVEIPNKK